jgi:hypothetical protein
MTHQLQDRVFDTPDAFSRVTHCLQGTIYGFGQNSKGACSYGSNFADTTGLPWSSAPAGSSDGGTGLATTFIALNAPQFELTASCGTCIWFRGTGGLLWRTVLKSMALHAAAPGSEA